MEDKLIFEQEVTPSDWVVDGKNNKKYDVDKVINVFETMPPLDTIDKYYYFIVEDLTEGTTERLDINYVSFGTNWYAFAYRTTYDFLRIRTQRNENYTELRIRNENFNLEHTYLFKLYHIEYIPKPTSTTIVKLNENTIITVLYNPNSDKVEATKEGALDPIESIKTIIIKLSEELIIEVKYDPSTDTVTAEKKGA